MTSLSPLFAPAFTLWGSPVTWLEIAAVGLSVWMVVCNLRVNPLGWPLAIAASVLYGLLFADSRLYGEAGLQVVFVLVAGWGWWQWLHGTEDGRTPLSVRYLPTSALAKLMLLTLAAWPLLGALLDHATDSDVPYFDALPTTFSLAGQWLLARKYVENWPTWVGVNAVSVALFASKGLWLTAVLYALFFFMALAGWRAWALRAQGAQGAR